MSKQRTDEWYQERAGKFTSSQFHRLMKSGRSKDKELGDTAISYIMEVIAEITTNGQSIKYKQIDTRATEWGNFHEQHAADFYRDLTGRRVEECGYFPINDFAGASPDRLIDDDGLLEIKCPYDTTNHIRYSLITDAETLKQQRQEYYYQVLGQMLATGGNGLIS